MNQGINATEKIRLLETALHSNYTRRQAENISVYQLINRLMLLYQMPLLFMFYKKVKGKNKFKFIFHTYKDIFFKDQFNQEIFAPLHEEKYEKDQLEHYYQLPHNTEALNTSTFQDIELPKNPYLIGDTRYAYIIIALWRDYQDRSTLYFKPFDKGQYSIIRKLWRNFLEREFSKALGVQEQIKKSFYIFHVDYALNKQKLITNNTVKKEELFRAFSNEEQHLLQEQLERLKKIFNDLYNRLSFSPLLSNNEKIPPNIMFFIRYYDEEAYIGRSVEETSQHRYDYALRLIIPEQQEEHIRLTLQAMKKAKRCSQTKTWSYQPYNKNHKLLEKQRCAEYVDIDLADKFWDYLRHEKANDEIIRILSLPYGKHVTGLVDSPLSQGFLEFKRHIFLRGGAERLAPSELEKGFASLEVKRFVIFHYLLSAISPTSDIENLGALAIPLRVSSSSYCGLLYTTNIQDRNSPELTGEAWLRNYHFFTDVARQIVSTLRRKTRKAYIEQLNNIIYTRFEDICKTITTPGFIFHENQAIEDVNKRFRFLCRIWPYPLVELFIPPNSQKTDMHANIIPFLNGRLPISFKIKKNPFFIRDGNHDFKYLSDKKIKTNFEQTFNKLENVVHFVYVNSRKDI